MKKPDSLQSFAYSDIPAGKMSGAKTAFFPHSFQGVWDSNPKNSFFVTFVGMYSTLHRRNICTTLEGTYRAFGHLQRTE